MRAHIRKAIKNATTPNPGKATPKELHLADAATQTSIEGKARAAMNAFQHGKSGHRMLLQTHELEAYRRLSTALYQDYKPANEAERQFVQKIIDCHTRFNRIVAIENNIIAIGVSANIRPDSSNDEETETMVAQARTWCEDENSFEKLGRYEGRISRQLVQYSKELDRIQDRRKKHEKELEEIRQPQISQTIDTRPFTMKPNSFRQTASTHSAARPNTAATAPAAPAPPPSAQPSENLVALPVALQ